MLDGGTVADRRRPVGPLDRLRRRQPSFETAASASAASAYSARSRNVNGEIRDALLGRPLPEQRAARRGTDRARRHRAASRASARTRSWASPWRRLGPAPPPRAMPLYRSLNANGHVLPVPLVNLINGGKHASNDLDFQEFIVIPVGADSILEALQISTEVNLALAEILLERYGKSALNTGDEGGYAPAISSPHEALGLLHEAVATPVTPAVSATGSTAPRATTTTAGSGTYEVAGERRDTDDDDRALPRADRRLRRGHDRGPARGGGLRGLRRADRERAVSRSSATTSSSPTRAGSRPGSSAAPPTRCSGR